LAPDGKGAQTNVPFNIFRHKEHVPFFKLINSLGDWSAYTWAGLWKFKLLPSLNSSPEG